jgi:hypothetical protein
MDIYALVGFRLKAIRYFYDTAAEPFLKKNRKIEGGEEPYDAPGNYESEEPPFLAEWEENLEGLTLLGHAGIAMLQVSLKLYLDSLREQVNQTVGKQDWKPEKKARDINWFGQYRQAFQTVLGFDWVEFGEEELGIVDQITRARDDIMHESDIWSVDTYQSDRHFAEYKESFFAKDTYLEHYKRTGKVLFGKWAIDVTPEKMRNALSVVDRFCKFMDDRWLDIVIELRKRSRGSEG